MFFPYFTTFIFGICIGSFINALVYRLQIGLPIIKARSICPACKKQLKWQHNIPVLSFMLLRGRCAFCKSRISWQYPLVELITGLFFVLSYLLIIKQPSNGAIWQLSNYSTIQLLFFWAVVFFLEVIFLFDLKYYLIPDKISIPAIIIVLFFQVILLIFKNFDPQFLISNFLFLIISAIIGGGWFLIQFIISKGKWVGGGDIRLGFLMGLILGWPGILAALALAYVGGAIISLPLLFLKKKTLKSQIPFGVFLAPATLAVMFWGGKIIIWYFSLF